MTGWLKESLTLGSQPPNGESKIMFNLHLIVKFFPSKHQNKYQ
jgi:hypothetical protein